MSVDKIAGVFFMPKEGLRFLIDEWPIDLFVIDTRTKEECDKFGSIETSLNIPSEDFEQAFCLLPGIY